MRQSKVYDYSEEEFQKIVQESVSMTDCCKRIGLSPNGSNGRNQIKKRCNELGIDYTALQSSNPPDKHFYNKREYKDILVEHSTYQNRVNLKNRLIKDGLLEYKCAICGNTGTWNNMALSLQLDHINGVNDDNRIENLRLLCPNCHSQTDTFSGKNLRQRSS